MHPNLNDLLVDPVHGKPMTFELGEIDTRGNVVSGQLRAVGGESYPIVSGIPRFVSCNNDAQQQTSEAFAFKWKKLDTYDSEAVKSGVTQWYLKKYNFSSVQEWAQYFNSRKAILDVGCGSGFSASLWLDTPCWQGKALYLGIDISEAVDVAQQRLSHVPNVHFVQADALSLPFHDKSFDTIFSEGVLHHTPSTREALLSASRMLTSGGEFHFYVYRRKGPVREFTDDYIREKIAPLSDEEAWQSLKSLTLLGKALAELHLSVTIPEDIPLLGIQAGTQDIQRLIYYTFTKLFWNEAFSFEENLHINFDWYRPRFAHRQSAEEVSAWCEEAGLDIRWLFEDESGITIRAQKR
jgi:arsenite methyltransferase